MDNEREYGAGDGLRERSDRSGGNNGNWDAVGSLRRNAKRPDEEVTPLLGNSGSSSEDLGNTSQEREWEGFDDFEGLTWWHRPSVSWAHVVDPHVRVLTLRSCTGYCHPSSSLPSHSEALLSPSSISSSPSYAANT